MLLSVLVSSVIMMSIIAMMTGRSSAESDDSRRRRYLNAEMGEVSDPEKWMRWHHRSDDDDEDDDGDDDDVVLEGAEGEPETEPSVERREWFAHWNNRHNRIFLIFNIIMQEKYNQWGRCIEPQFEHEVECWTSDETLK